MTSFSEAISLLANPTPNILDPEDDINSETVAKVNDEIDSIEPVYEISHLRSKTAPLLEDVDPKYAGRKVSRKALENSLNESLYIEDAVNEKFEESSEGETEEGIDSFLKLMRKQSSFSDNDSDGEDSSLDDQNEDYQKKSDLDEEIDEESIDSDEPHEKAADSISGNEITSEIEKGKAIKSQQDLWNKMCESRIKLQKLLILANKLPQFDLWPNLKSKGGNELIENQKKGRNSVKKLLHSLLTLQDKLSENNLEISTLENKTSDVPNQPSDEEIPSDNDEEVEQSGKIDISESKTVKRKKKQKDFDKILTKRHKSLIPYRNSVVQKWDEKTRLSTGRMTQKSFMAFDNSALKQIEQILQDKNRLIKRTQLKRTLYRVLGKPEVFESEENNKNDASKQDMLLKDYDPEIFDDDDFYRQMLKDVIESKSNSMDPAVLRKQMEIQKMRNKMKRNVDTKASKGRKLRYDVHQKLLNYMAPQQTATISDEARENLLKCLFGTSQKCA